MKKKKKIILGVIIISIISIVTLVIFIFKNTGKKLYAENYINYAWGHFESNLEIYDNGLMIYTANSDEEETKKKIKISNEELNKLKNLSLLVQDNYTLKKSDLVMFDVGSTTTEIYNKKIGKWIKLSYSADGGYSGYNESEETKKILDLVDDLTEKYNIFN